MSRRQDGWVRWTVILLAAAVMIVPLLFAVTRSLQLPPQVFSFPVEWVPRPIAPENYSSALDALGIRSFLNSILLASAVVIGQAALTIPAGFALATLRFPGRDAIFVLFLLALLIPFHIIMIPLFVIVFRLGILNTYQGMILPMIAQLSLAIFLYRQYFRIVPRELFEAASIDGANPLQILIRVYAPLAGPVTVSFVIVTFVSAWNAYVWPFLSVSSADLRPVVLELGIMSSSIGNQGNTTPVHVILAASILSALVPMVIFIVAQRRFVKTLSESGLVG